MTVAVNKTPLLRLLWSLFMKSIVCIGHTLITEFDQRNAIFLLILSLSLTLAQSLSSASGDVEKNCCGQTPFLCFFFACPFIVGVVVVLIFDGYFLPSIHVLFCVCWSIIQLSSRIAHDYRWLNTNRLLIFVFFLLLRIVSVFSPLRSQPNSIDFYCPFLPHNSDR